MNVSSFPSHPSHSPLSKRPRLSKCTMSDEIPVTLKWNKQSFSLSVRRGDSGIDLKRSVQNLTGVPLARQKILGKKVNWKGALKDDFVFDDDTKATLMVTLIGSAETLEKPKEQTKFIEDLSPEEVQQAEDARAQAAMADAEGMIPALQLPPHKRDDHKQEQYQYNRLVTGLPQRQIEQELRHGQGKQQGRIQGKVAMTLGLELRKGYINDLAVLDGDGTCVSVLDDGHVQLWKHAGQEEDVIHPGYEGSVNSVVSLRRKSSIPASFVTAGRGSLQFWNSDAEPLLNLPSSVPGTSPASLVAVYGSSSESLDSTPGICLAARFQVTRQSNPMQFRLPPQNPAERQRRAMAEAQERAIQEELAKASRSIQIWFTTQQQQQQSSASSSLSLQQRRLEPPSLRLGLEGSAPISCLTALPIPGVPASQWLVAGDLAGGLRFWKVTHRPNTATIIEHEGVFQLTPSLEDTATAVRIVCLQVLPSGYLAVSTEGGSTAAPISLDEATPVTIGRARAVHILKISSTPEGGLVLHRQSTLTGHTKDAVICMCALPNGDLLTGGGKLDATLQLWTQNQWNPTMSSEDDKHTMDQSEASLTEVGYVFALTVLPDAKEDSNYYAVAAGRYNTVKLIV